MLTWMLYVIFITLLLGGAALAAERSARLRRARTRWIWMVTILASLVIPTLIASISIQVPSLLTPTVSRKAIPLRDLTSVQVVPLTWVHEHTGNIVATHSENRLLQRTWIVVSVALLAALVLNGLQLVWRKRRWRIVTIAGVSVYIARDVGPAVVGLLRPRIVVPDWLLEASRSRQVMVLTHEQSHLAAYDPQLLTVALFLLVLMPWNLPLWWQLHRLRYAIEVDCDARVLKSGLDTGQYGETLIEVSQRPSGYIGSVAAMSESRSFLEKRITIMVRDPAKWGSLVTVLFGGVSVALLAVAAQVTPPNFGSSDSEQRPVLLTPAALEEFVGFYVRGAHTVFQITRDDAHLFLHSPWDLGVQELVPNSQMNFVESRGWGGPAIHFVRGIQGEITELRAIYGTAFSVPFVRIDEATAQTIKANNEVKARSQTPTPGSDAALRRLLDGIRSRNPNSEEMAPWLAELVREVEPLNEEYVRWGAVRSIEFKGVDRIGGDTYDVRQEGGVSTWTIWLDSNGLVQDIYNYRW